MKDIYEIWSEEGSSEIAFSTREEIERQRHKRLLPGVWKLLHTFEADDWTCAMTKYHELMEFEPYVP